MTVIMLDKGRLPMIGRALPIHFDRSTRTQVGIYQHFFGLVLFLSRKLLTFLDDEKSITLSLQMLISDRKILVVDCAGNRNYSMTSNLAEVTA